MSKKMFISKRVKLIYNKITDSNNRLRMKKIIKKLNLDRVNNKKKND